MVKPWEEGLVLDWATGLVVDKALFEGSKGKSKPPGLRTRKLKSSPTHKYHVGGPFNGTKLRRYTTIGVKKASKRLVELLPDIYEVPPYTGKYVFDEVEDAYFWTA